MQRYIDYICKNMFYNYKSQKKSTVILFFIFEIQRNREGATNRKVINDDDNLLKY